MIRYIIYIALGLIFSAVSYSQSQNYTKAKEWLSKSANAFNALSSYSVDLEFRVYGSHNSKMVLDAVKGKLKRSGEGSISDYKDAVIIENTNSKQTIMLDHINQMIIVRNGFEPPMRPLFSDAIDSMTKFVDSLTVIENDDIVEVSMWFPKNIGSAYEKVIVQINKSNNQISYLSLYYRYAIPMYEEESANQPGKLEIVYANFLENPSLPSWEFSASSYIKNDSGEWSGVNNYKNYQVFVNQQ